MTQPAGQILQTIPTTNMLTERGPLEILGNGFNFPKINDNKHFSGEFYVKKVINTDCVQCNILIYSMKADVIFVSAANCMVHKQQENW